MIAIPPFYTEAEKNSLKKLKENVDFQLFIRLLDLNAESIENVILKTPFTKETYEALQLRQIEAIKLRQTAEFGRTMLSDNPQKDYDISEDVLGTRDGIAEDLKRLKRNRIEF